LKSSHDRVYTFLSFDLIYSLRSKIYYLLLLKNYIYKTNNGRKFFYCYFNKFKKKMNYEHKYAFFISLKNYFEL